MWLYKCDQHNLNILINVREKEGKIKILQQGYLQKKELMFKIIFTSVGWEIPVESWGYKGVFQGRTTSGLDGQGRVSVVVVVQGVLPVVLLAALFALVVVEEVTGLWEESWLSVCVRVS